jgi:hypothetical protein
MSHTLKQEQLCKNNKTSKSWFCGKLSRCSDIFSGYCNADTAEIVTQAKIRNWRKSEIVEPQNFLIVRETKSTTYFPKKILGSIPTATKDVINFHTARSVFLKGIN